MGGCHGNSCHECRKCIKPPRTRKDTQAMLNQDGRTDNFIMGPKGRMKVQVEDNDDFLTHHLQNEVTMSKYASSHKIRARQIIQHYMFSDINHAKDTGSLSTSKLTEFALKSWFQRTFLEVLEKAEKGFLEEGRKYNEIRQQVAEEYIFEIYQMGQFINAGFGRFSTKDWHLEIPLSLVLLNSDSALFALLGRLQEKYPLVEQVPDMKFPPVQSTKTNISLLQLIKSRAYDDPEHLNRQTILDDLKVLIDCANDLFPDFKTDMQDMLGPSTEVDCKVKRQIVNQKVFYSAEAVRRVFIKWSETLIEKIPEVYNVQEFLQFIKSKKKMANEFIFKGTVSPTTHQQVMDSLAGLLQALKYKQGTKTPRQQFGLFIYDFLRCKTTRNTGEEVVQLLNKMKATKTTKSGKRFQVVRIKNRFNWATRDLLINFRYGENLVGQAQLCVDVPHDSPQLARKIKFRHYLYELQRGLFGPTFQMIMQYEDFTRKDIVVNLQTEGVVQKRSIGLNASHLVTKAQRMCPQKHQMIAIQGNIFSEDKITGYLDKQNQNYICDFCFSKFPLSKIYHYCYYCSIFYCTRCLQIYKKTDKKQIELNCMHSEVFHSIQSPQQLEQLCRTKKAVIAIFYRHSASASRMFLDQISYLFSAFKALGKPLPQISKINVSKNNFSPLLKKLNIERTPTTIIFNSRMQSQVTLVGSTFHDIESLLKVRERIANNLPKGLKMKCSICHQMMFINKGREKVKAQCQVCMDTNNMDDLKGLVRIVWLDTQDFVCKNGHVRCAYCSYLSSDNPSYYRDFTGRTYLSNKFVTKPSQCSNGHDMQSIPQPAQFKCSFCRRNLKGCSDQVSSYCKECDQYLCIDCEETDTQTLKEKWYRTLLKQIQIVTHFAEDRMEVCYPCGCGKYFLKVYQSRRIDNQVRMGTAVRELINEGAVRWKCFVCKKQQNKLRVHLACFYCPFASAIKGKPYHNQICIQCAMNSGMINREPKKKIFETPTELRCQKNHVILQTSSRDTYQLYFSCSFCKQNYYPYTQRYECRTCRIKVCIQCGDNNFVDTTDYKTDRKCKNNHKLLAMRIGPKMGFCNQCGLYLKEGHLKCPHNQCQFYLCLWCNQNTRKEIPLDDNKTEDKRDSKNPQNAKVGDQPLNAILMAVNQQQSGVQPLR